MPAFITTVKIVHVSENEQSAFEHIEKLFNSVYDDYVLDWWYIQRPRRHLVIEIESGCVREVYTTDGSAYTIVDHDIKDDR